MISGHFPASHHAGLHPVEVKLRGMHNLPAWRDFQPINLTTLGQLQFLLIKLEITPGGAYLDYIQEQPITLSDLKAKLLEALLDTDCPQRCPQTEQVPANSFRSNLGVSDG